MTCSSNYLDQNFTDNTTENDWYSIDTPVLQSILNYQFKKEQDYEDICKWFYVMMGRMLYNVEEYDNWQVMTHIIGKPTTGKLHC